MSKNVKDILEIISYVRENFDTTAPYNLSNLRLDAVYLIAKRREVDQTTVAHSYIRSFAPYIKGTKQFDRLLKEWIIDGSSELRSIIDKYSNYYFKSLIEEAFVKHTEEEIVLAAEFGFEILNKDFIEGKEKFKLHLVKERNQHLIREAKSEWSLKFNGNIKCSVCNFSFYEFYGDLGKDYIEAHHILPISSLKNETVMKISDLTPVCSNCHSMLHRNNVVLTIGELKKNIKKPPVN
jgi:predicted HNH restriction endonuclease